MILSKDDLTRWKTDPVTKQILNYLKHFNKELAQRHEDYFINSIRTTDEEFYRDSERYQTIKDLVELEIEDIEEFYDQASVGKISSQTD